MRQHSSIRQHSKRGNANAGFLGGAPRYNYGKANAVIEHDKLDRMERLRGIAGRHGVDLVAASLQFSLAPDVAAALIVGTASPEHLLTDHAALQAVIPKSFWEALREDGLLHRQAAVPEAHAALSQAWN